MSTTRFNPGMKSSLSAEWETPQWLYDELDRRFHFTLDPTASDTNHKCKNYFSKSQEFFTVETDTLTRSWAHYPPPGANSVYMNPPYGVMIGSFVAKAVDEYERGNVSPLVMLLPARTDTRWFQKDVFRADWLLFLKGRLKFELNGIPMENSAPFPSVIALWGSSWSYSLEGFEHLGRVVRLND